MKNFEKMKMKEIIGYIDEYIEDIMEVKKWVYLYWIQEQ